MLTPQFPVWDPDFAKGCRSGTPLSKFLAQTRATLILMKNTVMQVFWQSPEFCGVKLSED